jgi:hypothetical protein
MVEVQQEVIIHHFHSVGTVRKSKLIQRRFQVLGVKDKGKSLGHFGGQGGWEERIIVARQKEARGSKVVVRVIYRSLDALRNRTAW